MCRFSLSTARYVVESFFSNATTSDVLLEFDRTIGIYNQAVVLNGPYLVCTFSRLKQIPLLKGYFDLTTSAYYLYVSYGGLNSLGTVDNNAEFL